MKRPSMPLTPGRVLNLFIALGFVFVRRLLGPGWTVELHEQRISVVQWWVVRLDRWGAGDGRKHHRGVDLYAGDVVRGNAGGSTLTSQVRSPPGNLFHRGPLQPLQGAAGHAIDSTGGILGQPQHLLDEGRRVGLPDHDLQRSRGLHAASDVRGHSVRATQFERRVGSGGGADKTLVGPGKPLGRLRFTLSLQRRFANRLQLDACPRGATDQPWKLHPQQGHGRRRPERDGRARRLLRRRDALPDSLADTDLDTLDGAALAAERRRRLRADLSTVDATTPARCATSACRAASRIAFDASKQSFTIPANTRFYKTFLKGHRRARQWRLAQDRDAPHRLAPRSRPRRREPHADRALRHLRVERRRDRSARC